MNQPSELPASMGRCDSGPLLSDQTTAVSLVNRLLHHTDVVVTAE